MIRITSYLLFFLLTFQSILNGQSPFYVKYDLENGCPSNSLYDVNQGPNGYIWIAGEEGIAKFDGKKFIPIGNNQVDATNLINGKDSVIWAIGFNNTLLKIKNDQVYEELDWNSRSSSRVFTFIYDKENDLLWLSSNNGYLFRYNPSTSVIDSFNVVDLEMENLFARLIIPQGIINNKLYYGISSVGLFYFDYQTEKTYEIYSDSIMHHGKGVFFEKEKKIHWVYNWNRKKNIVFTLTGKKLVVNNQLNKTLNTNQVNRVQVLNDEILFSTNNGIFIYNKDYQLQDNQPLFPNYKCSQTILDREGNRWISTLKNGLLFLPNPAIKTYTPENSSIPEYSIYKLLRIKDQLYFNTRRKDVYFWQSDGQFNQLYDCNNQVEVDAILKLGPDSILYFNSNLKTYFYDLVHSKFIPSTPLTEELKLGEDIEFYKDKIVSANYVAALVFNNPIHKPNSPFPSFVDAPKTNGKKTKLPRLTEQRTIGVAVNPKDTSLWLATRTQLLRFSESAGTDTIKFQDKDIIAYAIDQDAENGIWVSIHQNVLQFQGDSVIKQLQYPYELLDDEISLIKVVGKNVYLGSKNGLQQYNITSQKNQNYQKIDGLPTHQISDVEEMGDFIYAASPKGLIEIPKKLDPHNSVPPKLIFQQLIVNQKDTFFSPSSPIKLTYQQNNLQFHLNTLSFKAQSNYQIQYKLEGVDKEWINVEQDYPIARYSKLKHGKYKFKAKAFNEDGVASEEYQLSLRITPAFWQTKGFYIFCILITGLIIYLLIKLRFKQLKQRSDLEKKVINSEITALKSQMNPHFIFNALNSIQHLIVKQDVRNTNIYLGKFATLLRMVLANSSKEKISLEKELEILQIYLDLENLRFGKDFIVSIDVDPNIEPDIVFIPPMILQPYIENAIKHGLLHKKGTKRLRIQFKKEENHLYCNIQDNGIGRAASQKINERRSKYHQSFAQKANEKRIDLINAIENEKVSLEITDLSEGTLVVIGFPDTHKNKSIQQ